MALTVDRVGNPTAFGDRSVGVFDVTFDSAYVTGGESLTASDAEVPTTIDLVTVTGEVDGYVCSYDYANSKLQLFEQTDPAAAGGANVPLVEVGNATDVDAVTVRVLVIGSD